MGEVARTLAWGLSGVMGCGGGGHAKVFQISEQEINNKNTKHGICHG